MEMLVCSSRVQGVLKKRVRNILWKQNYDVPTYTEGEKGREKKNLYGQNLLGMLNTIVSLRAKYRLCKFSSSTSKTFPPQQLKSLDSYNFPLD